MSVAVDGKSLTIEKTVKVARENEAVILDPNARERMLESRRVVEEMLERGDSAYGIKTGFGELECVVINDEEVVQLQKNLLHSHAATVGPMVNVDVVRAMMLHRANALSKGFSGVRPVVVETLISMLNANITPVVFSKGSLGASGDLAPLSHIALALMGKGRVRYKGEIIEAVNALEAEGITPLVIRSKEGLGLVNGTQYMSAMASLCLHDAYDILAHAQIASAMSAEALLASERAYDSRIMEARPHPGQMTVARNMRALMKDSPLVSSHKNCGKHQDAYSIRCIPQVFGACLDALNHAKSVVEREINSVTDNPLVFPDTEEVIPGGNFHGEPLALVLDFAAMAASEIANLEERMIYRLLDNKLGGLPPFLASDSGLNSGFMIAQYTAAALVNENKVLCHPASVDSIPSSAGQEDHVSMGATGANKLRSILDNGIIVASIHLTIAAQALDMSEHPSAVPTKAAKNVIRTKIPYLDNDEQHIMSDTLETARQLVLSGKILEKVSESTPLEEQP